MMRDVVIVGGSLAGLRAAESLRTGGYAESITVVGDEPHLPYDRPPLSKRLLSGEWEPDRILLRKPDDMASIDVRWRTGTRAVSLDLDDRAVALDGGDRLPFDGLVIATGATPRRLPGQGDHDHVVVLRTLDDALDLRDRIVSGDRRVVVIGAGFIGLEVAATARQLGNDVLVLEGAPAPLGRALGHEMGAAVSAVHAEHGVEIRCDVEVEGFATGAVLVGGGRHERADVVVVGIGVAPATDWLVGSGLQARRRRRLPVRPQRRTATRVRRWRCRPLAQPALRRGDARRTLDERRRAGSPRRPTCSPRDSGRTDPALRAGAVLLERAVRAAHPVPRTCVGPDDEVRIVAGSVDERRFAALFGREGRLRGVLGVDMPRQVMPFRNHLLERISWDEALELATGA
jgi:hypothetical protein